MFRSKLFVGSLVAATTLSAFILSSTTVNAETYTKSALIRVSSACTMSGAVATAHTATVNGGTYTPDIGESVLTTVCNDSGGFAVYAIGFTNEMDGNNVMEHSTNPSATIATGTATSGQTSNWAMKLTPHQNGDNTPTIENGYDSYSVVPSDYIKVASYPSATAESASVSFKTYYAVYVSRQQTSGTYNGKVKYVLVHPANGEAPEKDPDPLTTTFDEAFGNAGKTKVTVNNQQYYKEQDMTSFICDSITEGQTTELVDIRDNTIYHVGKLADGRCWMLDNLALDPVANGSSLTPSNTNATQAAIDNYLTSSGTAPQTGWATEAVSYETSSSVYDQPRINIASKDVLPTTYNSTDEPLASIVTSENWKVGIYYNYCAASIGTYCYASGQGIDKNESSAIDADQDICPANWRMPTGGPIGTAGTTTGGGEYQTLYNAYPAISGGDSQYTRFRKVLRLPLSGNFDNGSAGSQGYYGRFWSSTYGDSYYMYYLYVNTSNINPQGNSYRYRGSSIRCIAK